MINCKLTFVTNNGIKLQIFEMVTLIFLEYFKSKLKNIQQHWSFSLQEAYSSIKNNNRWSIILILMKVLNQDIVTLT